MTDVFHLNSTSIVCDASVTIGDHSLLARGCVITEGAPEMQPAVRQ